MDQRLQDPAGAAPPDWRGLCSRMADELDHYRQLLTDDHREVHPLAAEARAVLARFGHQPEPPAEGEVAELVAWLRDRAESTSLAHAARRITRAADLLEQRHPAPVPVSERKPGPDDCLDEGWAWFFSPRVGWRQAVLPVSPAYTHWLPATALPLPAGEVE